MYNELAFCAYVDEISTSTIATMWDSSALYSIKQENLQTNTNPQIISLVSNVSKLFRKLTSRI